MQRRLQWLLATLALGALTAGAVVASVRDAHADPLGIIAGEELDVTADSLDVDVDDGSAILTGSVKVRLGELSVECARVDVRYDTSPHVRWARATGAVVARVAGIEATASTMEVAVAEHQVTLSGAVRLSRGKGWLTAERATIDLTTKKLSLQTVKGAIPVVPPPR